jgi:hypothetical protein
MGLPVVLEGREAEAAAVAKELEESGVEVSVTPRFGELSARWGGR